MRFCVVSSPFWKESLGFGLFIVQRICACQVRWQLDPTGAALHLLRASICVSFLATGALGARAQCARTLTLSRVQSCSRLFHHGREGDDGTVDIRKTPVDPSRLIQVSISCTHVSSVYPTRSILWSSVNLGFDGSSPPFQHRVSPHNSGTVTPRNGY